MTTHHIFTFVVVLVAWFAGYVVMEQHYYEQGGFTPPKSRSVAIGLIVGAVCGFIYYVTGG